MRIGINALYLLPGKVGGTEIFVRELVKNLAEVDSENDYSIFINRESAGIFSNIASNISVVPCPINATSRPARVLWEQFVLPFQVFRRRLDVLYCAGMTSPFVCPAPTVVILYDLQHVNQPKNFSWIHLFFLRAIIFLSARTAKVVITISKYVKNDIIKHYRLRPENVYVTYCGLDASVFFRRNTEEVKTVREKYTLPEQFILYIASSLPHKNHKRLLEAFKIVNQRNRDVKLVLVGARDYGHELIAERIRELGLEDEVTFLGWLPFEDISPLYSASKVFVFPTLHEGFGMPVIEAMACGVPVVCSKIEPLVEISRGAAYMIDPLSVEEIAEGLEKVLTDSGLRVKLIEAGMQRARVFSWRKMAADTLDIFRHIGPGVR